MQLGIWFGSAWFVELRPLHLLGPLEETPHIRKGFRGGSDSKQSTCNAGDPGLLPGWGRFLGKKIATHSSILAWRILWTGETGGLQSMGSQRVRHD